MTKARVNQNFRIKVFKLILALFAVSISGSVQAANIPEVTITPDRVLSGETILGSAPAGEKIDSVEFENSSIPHFTYNNRDSFLIGIDLKHASGTYPVVVNFKNGNRVSVPIDIRSRQMPQQPMDIPEKLGGNTTSSQQKLVSDLGSENNILANLKTYARTLWTKPFIYPLEKPFVTDPYGYNRETGSYVITHKGTDFRAAEGTKILAMNRGIVRLARNLRIYGKTIVIDHGQGVETFYMHLSKIKVNQGQLVTRGQIIGLSGKTGYAESPHLHASVHVNQISVDPVKFLDLFKMN